MRRKIFVQLLVCAFYLPAACAALTLEEAISLGLKNNTQILTAREATKASAGRNSEVISAALPKITLSGGYNYISSVPSMSISIPTGPFTSVEKTVVTGANDNWLLRAQLTDQLFDWGRMSDNVYAAGAANSAAERDFESVSRTVIYSVKQSYFGVVFANETLAVNEESLKVAGQHLEDASRKYKEGASSSYEVLRSKVLVSNLKPAVSKAKNNLEMAKLSLKIALGIKLAEDIDVSGKLIERSIQLPDYESKLKIALATRPELLAARLRIESARKAVESAGTLDKPSLTGFASYNYQNPYYTQLSWTQSWNAGVNLSVPLFDGNFAAAKVTLAESDLATAEIAAKRLEESTSSELKQLVFSLFEAKERIEAQKDAIAQAEEYHKIAQVGFKSGTMTNLEVIDAELSLMNARIGYLQALYDREVIEAGIERITGLNPRGK